MRLLLLFFLFPFFPFAQEGRSPAHPLLGPVPYDIIHYEADLQFDLAQRTITGAEKIRLQSRASALSEIALDAKDITVKSVSDERSALRFEMKDGRLLVRFNKPLALNETRTLRLSYQAQPKRGVQFFEDHLYASYSTSTWLVCNFHPGDKATLTLRLTLPAGMKVVANGRMIEERALPHKQMLTVWQQDIPAPAYIYGFAAGHFREVFERHGRLQLRYLARNFSVEEIKRIFAETTRMMDFFEKRARVPYPEKTYTQVLVAGRMPGQELSSFTELPESYGREVLDDPQDVWLMAHELAHQWWGNNVTCADWSHFWLNEGMATFLAAAYKEDRFSRILYDEEIESYRRSYARIRGAGRDRPLAFQEWRPEAGSGGAIVYDKGALILHLLRFQLGEEIFWDGVRRYTRQQFGKSVTTDDLQRAFEDASGQSLSDFFNRWVYQAGVPRLVARHRLEGRELVVEIEQQQAELWMFPLNIAVETASGRQNRRVMMKGKLEEIRFPLNDRLLSVRVDDGGYLPFRIEHQRPTAMLLHQLVSEPDVAGRVNALDELQAILNGSPTQEVRASIIAALRERVEKDSSQMVRKLSQEALKGR